MQLILQRFTPSILSFFSAHVIPPDKDFKDSAADPEAVAPGAPLHGVGGNGKKKSGSGKKTGKYQELPRVVMQPRITPEFLSRLSLAGTGEGGAAVGKDSICVGLFPLDEADEGGLSTSNATTSSSITATITTSTSSTVAASAALHSNPVIRRRVLLFVEDHREVLNALLRVDPALIIAPGAPLAPLISTRSARLFLDFTNKRNFFYAQLKAYCGGRPGTHHFGTIPLEITREHLLQESKSKFDEHLAKGESLRGRLDVRYKGEEGIDAGGLSREWYTIVAREMFRPDYGMWKLSEDGVTYQPNPLSAVLKGKDHLSWFKFVGRVLGKAVADGYLLDIHFTRSLYKHFLGLPVSFNDLKYIDPEYHKSLGMILEHGVVTLGLEDTTFTVTSELSLDNYEEVALVPGGGGISLNDANAPAYVSLASHHKMTGSITLQCNALLEGFAELIPPSLISIFSPEELELLLAGLPHIDVGDLRANTEYGGGYRQNHEVIQWFWAAVESFNEQDKARLLMFVTGTSKVPLGGFKDLRGQRGPQKFTIQKMSTGGDDALPASHTCFNSLDLPLYKDPDTLRDKLLVAIREGGEGFGNV